MNYFVTGGTGFIGKFLIEKLLQREGNVYVLLRESSAHKLEQLQQRFPLQAERIIPVFGDLAQPALGVADADIEPLKGNIDHFFHLAAIYDLAADEESQRVANIEGTRHAIQCAEKLQAKCFQHCSSVAASGLYKGIFREDMFEEAENLDSAYFLTKHESEAIVRKECNIPWRVYRPAAVLGHSQTGEIDKVDGPYYMFTLLKKLRSTLPQWMPLPGVEMGLLNAVPVDYVVNAMDYIAHQPEQDGNCFHLTDPDHYSMGEMMNIFADAANAPKMAVRFDPKIFRFVPNMLVDMVSKLGVFKRLRATLFDSLGMPEESSVFMKYQTRYDNRDAAKLLEQGGIECPRLSTYAPQVWDYWERNLDPDLFIDKSLEGNVRGKLVLVTGASSGIGESISHMLAEAGARVILAARSEDKLLETKAAIEEAGGEAHIYTCDVSDLDACDNMVAEVLKDHGHIDILINNAGRSIRRSIDLSYDRFHDFERTMQLNYFGALRLILGFLPSMTERRSGHVINISSIGVLSSSPRFSAYVASKSALDAFSRCAASEFSDRKVSFTNINMPLVRTPMIAPTKIYDYAPALTVEEAMGLVVEAIVNRPWRVATPMGKATSILNTVAPKLMEIVWNTSYRMFPDSAAARGEQPAGSIEPSNEQVALANIMKGVHF